MSRLSEGVGNNGKAEDADSGENDENGGGSGAKRARQQGSRIIISVGNNNSSSNSHNNASNNSSHSSSGFRQKNEEEYGSNKNDKWGGTRVGAGRKPKVTANMQMVDNSDDSIDNIDMDKSISVASSSAKKREASKREMSRLLEIEKETCRTRGSGLTVETCLIVISLFTQRIREAISVKFP